MADMEAAYRVRLIQEFERRKTVNKRYSLRAYARSLGVDGSYFSKLLSGKILLSLDLADNLTKKLKLSKEERTEFLLSAAEEQKCHALYLIDPALTECNPALDILNKQPQSKKTE